MFPTANSVHECTRVLEVTAPGVPAVLSLRRRRRVASPLLRANSCLWAMCRVEWSGKQRLAKSLAELAATSLAAKLVQLLD